MGVMSDLALLADEVRDNVQTDMDVDEAVDAVAQHSAYDAEKIEWAYYEKHVV